MTSSNINLPFITMNENGPQHLDLTLTRAKFNELTADLVEKTMGPTRQALKDAGLSANDINKVILVGGSSRIPAVQDAIKNLLGKETVQKALTLTNALPSVQPFRAVC